MLKVLRDSLQAGLNATNKVVSTRSTLPSLACVLLTANGEGDLILSATNLETALQLKLGAKVDEPFGLCVPSKTFAQVVFSRTEDIFTLSHDKEHETLQIKSGRFKSSIAGLAAEEFPMLPDPVDFVEDSDLTFDISTKELLSSLQKVLISVATGGQRPTLETVLFRFNNGLQLITTDGYTLSVQTLHADGTGSYMIPATGLQQIVQLLQQFKPDYVKIVFKKLQVMFVADDFSIMCQLQDGNYPDVSPFERNAGKKPVSSVTLNTDVLKQTLKTAMVYYNDTRTPLKIEAKNGRINVHIHSNELGLFEESLEVVQYDDTFKTSLNVGHLNNIIKVLEGEQVVLATYENNMCPVYVYPNELNSENYWISMPLFVKGE